MCIDRTVLDAIQSEVEGLQAIYDKNCVLWESNSGNFDLGTLTVRVALNGETSPAAFQFFVRRNYFTDSPGAQVLCDSQPNKMLTEMLVTSIREHFRPPGTFSFFHVIEHVRQAWLNIHPLRKNSTELPSPPKRPKAEDDPRPVVMPTLPRDPISQQNIYSGSVIVERKSAFQAHVASVFTTNEVKLFMSKLLSCPKIQKATHNIRAYRLKTEPHENFEGPGTKKNRGKTVSPKNTSSVLQDHDSDGEKAAGGRLQHLLEILDVRNVVVVVSRWYGGIPLGPQRFRLINNCARQALVDGGFLKK